MDEALRSIAGMLMKRMCDTLAAGKSPEPLALFKYGKDPVLLPLPGRLMDDGRAKNILFDLFRDICNEEQVEVFGFASEAWACRVTEKAAALAGLSHEEIIQKLQSAGMETLMREGIASRVACVQVVVESRERTIIASRNFAQSGRRFNWLGEPEYHELPQSSFEGSLKMWGERTTAGEMKEGVSGGEKN